MPFESLALIGGLVKAILNPIRLISAIAGNIPTITLIRPNELNLPKNQNRLCPTIYAVKVAKTSQHSSDLR